MLLLSSTFWTVVQFSSLIPSIQFFTKTLQHLWNWLPPVTPVLTDSLPRPISCFLVFLPLASVFCFLIRPPYYCKSYLYETSAWSDIPPVKTFQDSIMTTEKKLLHLNSFMVQPQSAFLVLSPTNMTSLSPCHRHCPVWDLCFSHSGLFRYPHVEYTFTLTSHR